MEKMKEIALLKEDGCTQSEAERYLKKGTMIFSEQETDDFLMILNQGEDEPYTLLDVEANRVTDAGFVTYEGVKYYIVYVN